MIDKKATETRLYGHLEALTRTIGERSVRTPANLDRTADYIHAYYDGIDLPVRREAYAYHNLTVYNVVSEIRLAPNPSYHYVVGAHYDSVAGTVGADDNASAVAVQLETARELKALAEHKGLDLAVTFVSFALEEPPAYGTRFMGSRVFALKAKKEKLKIDGMICLEMVGYACRQPGCQRYPFPLKFFGYPKQGDFIGIVGNFGSRSFSRRLKNSFAENRELPVISLSIPFNGWILPAVRLSDHASFWDNGFKAVMVTDSAFFRNPYYHTAADTMEKLDIGFMSELVESLVMFFYSH